MDFTEYMEELADGSVQLRVSDLQRLSRLSDDRERQFASLWSKIDVRRRRRIVQELVDLAEDNVEINFDTVFVRGLEDEDANVRRVSVLGLWEHEAPDVIGPLLRLLEQDEDAAVRAEAALALGRFVTLSAEGKLRERHLERIESGLRQALERKDDVLEVRARALEAIGPQNEPWVRQAISEAYESGVHRLKVSAVHAMGRSCEERWLPLIRRELSSDEPEVRYEAAVACGSLGDERAIPDLIKLAVDPDQEVKQAGILALGEIGGGQAKQALMTLLDSESDAVRDAALAALTQLEFEQDPLSFKFRS